MLSPRKRPLPPGSVQIPIRSNNRREKPSPLVDPYVSLSSNYRTSLSR